MLNVEPSSEKNRLEGHKGYNGKICGTQLD